MLPEYDFRPGVRGKYVKRHEAAKLIEKKHRAKSARLKAGKKTELDQP